MDRLGKPEVSVRAPGRANIIGEHIDYCDGYVLPFALSQAMYFVFGKKEKGASSILAADLNQQFVIKDLEQEQKGVAYFIKCLRVLHEHQLVTVPFKLLFTSSIPTGGGLSSSTALCCGFISGLNTLNDFGLSNREIITLASEAERGMGVEGGLMDQYAIMYGEKGKALHLDCRNYKTCSIKLSKSINNFALIDTGIQHTLATSAYNERRQQTENGLLAIRRHTGSQLTYRDLELEMLSGIDEPVSKRRIRHVIEETRRVGQATHAIKESDCRALGQLLNASHASLRDLYDVSCSEADYLVKELNSRELCFGARIVGGGFGGHVLALLNNGEHTDQGLKQVQMKYKERFDKIPVIRSARPSDGLRVRLH